MRNLSGGGPQPVLAPPTRAGPTSRPKPAPRPGPVIQGHCGRALRATGVLQTGGRWGFCSIRSWLSACRRRVEPSCSAIPPAWWRPGHIRRTYSSAPPEAGRGDTQVSRYPRRRLDEGPGNEHDRVVQRVERPRVCDVLPGLHVHERQDDRERQVHEEVLPLVRVHVRKKSR